MSTTAIGTAGVGERRNALSWVWSRQLDHYPNTGPRVLNLAIVVLATIILYYELYVGGGAAPLILQHFHMSFTYYVYISVVGNAIGAFSSVIAGLCDRFGRANLIVYGLLVTGLLTLLAVPNAPSRFVFGLEVVVIGFVEGIILVATPAVVRDFSPQVGRATAMGFWTLGPVIGSLIVSIIATHTLTASRLASLDWQSQFDIAGIVGLVVFFIAFVGLRELSPGLRDQLMVSMRDRVLVEAKAKGIDIEASLRRPWRQMLHLDIVGSAFGIAVFLLVYYAAVGFFTIYLTTVFGFTTQQANGILVWDYAINAGSLIIIGFVSDRLRVRKPFMVAGGLGAIAMVIYLLVQTTNPHTGYYHLVFILSLLSFFLALAYAPWMASFTETAEARNPALIATGLAVWGWIIRAVVALSAIALPIVVSSVTPLVSYGTTVAQAGKIIQADPNVSTVLAHPALFTQLAKYPPTAIPPALLQKAVATVGPTKLQAIATDTKLPKEIAFFTANKAVLTPANIASVTKAAKQTPGQWQEWFWVCVAGIIVFLPLTLIMRGRWDPRKAKADLDAHEAAVQQELAHLPGGVAVAGR